MSAKPWEVAFEKWWEEPAPGDWPRNDDSRDHAIYMACKITYAAALAERSRAEWENKIMREALDKCATATDLWAMQEAARAALEEINR